MKSFNQFLDEAKKKKCPEGKVRNKEGKCVKRKTKSRTTNIFVLGGRRFGVGYPHDEKPSDQDDQSNIISDNGDGGGGDGGGGGGE